MKMRDENQNKRLHLLLGKASLLAEKPELVSFFTDGRTTSSRELTYEEAENFINYLEGMSQLQKTSGKESTEKMRRNIIAICYELGWIENSDNPEERKMNMAVIDSFIKQRGYIKKPLNDFTLKELPKLVSQFKQILQHSKQTAGSKATKNLLAELNIPVQPAKRK
jgi:hypothetical protein